MAFDNDGKRAPKPGAWAARSLDHYTVFFEGPQLRTDPSRNSNRLYRERREREDKWDDAREEQTIRDRNHYFATTRHRRDRVRDVDKRHGKRDPLPSSRTRTSLSNPHPASHQIDVKSLDHGYPDWKITVRHGPLMLSLEKAMRLKFEQNLQPLEAKALFRFFASDGRELTQEDLVTTRLSQIWYRVSRFSGEVEAWKFTHYQDETHGRLDSAFTDELARYIDAGATVRQLRRKIADQWDIDDANRVLLIARGGFRPGSIKGNDWLVKEIKDKWLCRWIAIDIWPEKHYFVLKGLRREYILHPERLYANISQMKDNLRDRVFRGVRQQYESSSFSLPPEHITISYKGKAARTSHQPAWGAEYTFELRDSYQAEVFSDEEAWLLPATETCIVCVEDKKISDLPVRVTARCKHETTTCKACLDQWLTSSLEFGTWDKLKCPECPELLEHTDVHRGASKATRSRYDDLATRALLKNIPNFRWCLSTTCTSGQIDDISCPKFKCKACKASHCTTHNVPWHKGETCEQYDKRNKRRLKEDKASENTIKKTSKKCPECKRDVEKFAGCNHITCTCGHEWCYICFARFERNNVGLLFCRHKDGCTERDPFLELVEDPLIQRAHRALRDWEPWLEPRFPHRPVQHLRQTPDRPHAAARDQAPRVPAPRVPLPPQPPPLVLGRRPPAVPHVAGRPAPQLVVMENARLANLDQLWQHATDNALLHPLLLASQEAMPPHLRATGAGIPPRAAAARGGALP